MIWWIVLKDSKWILNKSNSWERKKNCMPEKRNWDFSNKPKLKIRENNKLFKYSNIINYKYFNNLKKMKINLFVILLFRCIFERIRKPLASMCW